MSKNTSRSSSKASINRTQPRSVTKRFTTRTAKANTPKPIQFNWRKHWEKKVKPHLNHPCVQMSLGIGMVMIDPTWKDGDAPYKYGSKVKRLAKEGTLAWYQPRRQCHAMAFFAMAIGLINYPNLQWNFVSGLNSGLRGLTQNPKQRDRAGSQSLRDRKQARLPTEIEGQVRLK